MAMPCIFGPPLGSTGESDLDEHQLFGEDYDPRDDTYFDRDGNEYSPRDRCQLGTDCLNADPDHNTDECFDVELVEQWERETDRGAA